MGGGGGASGHGFLLIGFVRGRMRKRDFKCVYMRANIFFLKGRAVLLAIKCVNVIMSVIGAK